MPILDMPLEKLKQYGGVNPRPEDFDAYWDRALKELKAVDPQVELVPASFQCSFAECFDLFYTGVGGARVHAKYLRPRNIASPSPALLQFHGYTASAGSWSSKLQYVAAGFCVAAMDCRGQGGLSEDVGGVYGNTLRGHIIRGLSDSPDKLLFRSVFLDTAELASIVMGFEEVDQTRVSATGGSQGGGLTLVCASLCPSLYKAAPVYPFLSDYKRVWDMDLAENAYAELRDYFRLFDPTHAWEKEIFTTLGYIDIQNLVGRIKCDVLMFTGLMDKVCPPSTQFAAYNKITASKNMVIYPDFGHENLPNSDDTIFQYIVGK